MDKQLRIMLQKVEMLLSREEKMLMHKKGIINSSHPSMKSLPLFLRSAMSKMMITDLFNRSKEVLR